MSLSNAGVIPCGTIVHEHGRKEAKGTDGSERSREGKQALLRSTAA